MYFVFTFIWAIHKYLSFLLYFWLGDSICIWLLRIFRKIVQCSTCFSHYFLSVFWILFYCHCECCELRCTFNTIIYTGSSSIYCWKQHISINSVVKFTWAFPSDSVITAINMIFSFGFSFFTFLFIAAIDMKWMYLQTTPHIQFLYLLSSSWIHHENYLHRYQVTAIDLWIAYNYIYW